MLREIHIQNYAVIENLKLDFHPGLNVLSGETGSGKSILVDALGLTLGGRASPDLIRAGRDRATVTAVFHSESHPPWAEWLEECGLGGPDESEIILRREIQAGGKSRLLVNDQPVTVAAVKALGQSLAEVHGQSEHVTLFARDAQLDLLDQFAGTDHALQMVEELFRRRRELEGEMESLRQNEQERLRTIDLLSFQAQELDRAELQPGEDARLEDERRLLSNLEKIRAAAASAFVQLYEEEGAACSRLAVAGRGLEELRSYDPAFEPYLEPLAGARAMLEDLAFFLRNYLGKLDANPRRLEEVEDRLVLIDRLKRKYGKTIEEVLAYRQATRQRLSTLEHADERRSELRGVLERAATEYRETARALSNQRREAARKLEKLIREELAQLGMEKTQFQVWFKPLAAATTDQDAQGGRRGIDEIELRISPNPGEELRPLEKIASGGELSRLMLALKTVLGTSSVGATRRVAPPSTRRVPPTFIFDEVDAGIGGRVAECVGQRLKRLAREAQVLCVTHLAQIACFADHHFYVEKFERAGRTLVAVRYLQNESERAQELARMLSGAKVTDAALKHATAMLKQAAG